MTWLPNTVWMFLRQLIAKYFVVKLRFRKFLVINLCLVTLVLNITVSCTFIEPSVTFSRHIVCWDHHSNFSSIHRNIDHLEIFYFSLQQSLLVLYFASCFLFFTCCCCRLLFDMQLASYEQYFFIRTVFAPFSKFHSLPICRISIPLNTFYVYFNVGP